MLGVEGLTVTFSGTDLFSDISFLINDRDRIGLVGKNGAGKTTLLRIITGEVIPTKGSVNRNADCTIGYLPQTMDVTDDSTLMAECYKAFDELLKLEAEIAYCTEQVSIRVDYQSEEYESLLHRLHDATERFHMIGGESREADVERTLLGLGFRREQFDNLTATLSGGWRMRIELAKILLQRPTLLLLDEPTNHLDIESIQWLEEYLINFNGAVVLISHDRAFLDNITTRTIEMSLGKIADYRVPYSHYVILRQERLLQQIAAYENQQRMIEKTEEFIGRFRYQASKSNQVQSRVKHLEKIDRIEVDEEDLSRLNIRFPSAPRSGQIAIETKDVGHSFDKKHVFSGADIVVERGEKVALVGKNGEGKTTFVRQIVSELTPTRGIIRIGHNVNIGYFAQNQEDLMDGEFTVYDTLDRVAVGDVRNRIYDILGAFLFRKDDTSKRVKVLSGGERSRLAMARLILEPYNLLILDEPTNHMDMRSKDVLKQALQKYNGTVIIISHDREFLDQLVNVVYEFSNGKVRQHLGGIYDYIETHKRESEQRKEESTTASTPQPALTSTPKQENGKKEKLPQKKVTESYQQQREREREENRRTNARKRLEEEISKLESKLSSMEEALHNPEQYNMELFNEYNAIQKQLDKKMEQWGEFI